MAGVFHHDGVWYDEAPKILSPMDQATWLSSIVFDGARSFGGLAPDLDRHCQRLIRSARALLLEPKITAEAVQALCVEAIRKLPREAELYVRPMMYATGGFLVPDPDTRLATAPPAAPRRSATACSPESAGSRPRFWPR